MIQTLQTIDAETLLNTPLPSAAFVVENLLPEGLHILAGAPKIGKSWFALWLCLCIAKGEPVWNFQTHKGCVLYLCLEDSFARIQNRLFQLTEDAPDTLHFGNMSNCIGAGLETQIEDFLQKNPKTVLIVIDTLQKVRRHMPDANPYASDYQDIARLKELADRNHIAILLIHHLRKQNDDDPMNMISGTTGISGATDSNFVLKPEKRGSSQAILYCTGRDIEYQELRLQFSSENHMRELLSDTSKANCQHTDAVLELLIPFLKSLSCFDGTATELSGLLAQKTGENMLPNVLSKKLVRYADELTRNHISFRTSRTRDMRLLHIRCDGSDGNDGKINTGSVPDLLSQPSHLSHAPELSR